MASIETSIDLKQLSLRAGIACAVRCARRVQPLYAPPIEHPDVAGCIEAIDRALALAERFAAGNDLDTETVAQTEEATIKALMAVSQSQSEDHSAAYAANAAYAVIDAVEAALACLQFSDTATAAQRAIDSMAIATDAALMADASVGTDAQVDWQNVKKLQLGSFPELGKGIDPAETGVLGPWFRASTGVRPRGTSAKPAKALLPPSSPGHGDDETPKPDFDSSFTTDADAFAERMRTQQNDLHNAQVALDLERAELLRLSEALCADREQLESEKDAILTERRKSDAAKLSDIDEVMRQRAEMQLHAAALEETQLRIESAQMTFALERQQFDAARQRLDSEREQFEAERKQIRADRDDTQNMRLELQVDRDSFQEEQNEFHSLREQLQREKKELQAQRKAQECASKALTDEQHRLDAFRIDTANIESSLREQAENNRAWTTKLDTRCDNLDAREAMLLNAEQELESARAQFATEQEQQASEKQECDLARNRMAADYAQYELDRDAFQSDASRLQEEVARLEQQFRECDSIRRELDGERATIVDRETTLVAAQEYLAQAANQHAAQVEQFERERRSITESIEELEEQRAEVHRKCAIAEQEFEEIREARARLVEEWKAFQIERTEFQQDCAVAFASERANLDAERAEICEAAALADSERQRLKESLTSLIDERRLLDKQRSEIAEARGELCADRDGLESQRITFLEERASVARKEVEIQKALCCLREECMRLAPEKSLLRSWSHQNPQVLIADLQALLNCLHEERGSSKSRQVD